MSYGDPNNPYGQPPQQPPGGQPGYGYPQQAPQGQPYGYPQQQGYPGYPGYPAGPGGNMMPQSMPGLLMTARVFLFIISAPQILYCLVAIYGAAVFSDASDLSEELDVAGLDSVTTAGTGIFVILALITGGLAALSITLGVKFSSGGQGVRVTTIVYGALGCVPGVWMLFVGLDTGLATATIPGLIWTVFAVIITVAPAVPSGAAWFNRPRY
ncbi:hypothetical protein DY218_27940 [Streptomyces triticagri]|uniref:Uncharacterized protein n=1 Tax=Streptomyces triticagri TaxID=2293568 RepID=A0A372LXM0_9ACTN|nr:hypothetical protein [Streptomyces triticagri]RFU83402.1 hypothetical protein DY218_27940 [Streptomyces triticagri]